MLPRAFYRLLQCPTCGSRDLFVLDDGVHCHACATLYPFGDGFVDLMPRSTDFGYVSKYVTEEAEMAEELDYRDLAPPLLAAGVRERVLRRLLRFRPTDIFLDNGCGNGRFGVWYAPDVALSVGSDPAILYADEAKQLLALAKADARRLPFADDMFDKALSVDVLEHFPLDVIDDYLRETARVLRPGGRLAAFSNTKELSQLQPIIDGSKRLGQWFVHRGVYDFEREARRKSDHIKALPTYDDVRAAMERAGLRVVEVRFWNTVVTSFVEHVLMKLGEALLARRSASSSHAASERMARSGEGTQREIVARRRIRPRLNPESPVYWGLYLLTSLMELDVTLWGHLRTGPYFILVEKPVEPAPSGSAH